MNARQGMPLHDALKGVTKAQKSHLFRRGLMLGIATTVLLGCVFAWLDVMIRFSPLLRGIGLILALLSGMAFVGIGILRARRFTVMDSARAYEKASPDLGQQLRTCLEVEQKQLTPMDGLDKHRLMLALTRSVMDSMKRLKPELILNRQALVLAVAAMVGSLLFMEGSHLYSSTFRVGMQRLMEPGAKITYTQLEIQQLPDDYDEDHPPAVSFSVSGAPAEPVMSRQLASGKWEAVPLARDGRTSGWCAILKGDSTDIPIRITAGDADPIQHRILYLRTPKLTGSKAVIHFPDYTGLKDETVKGGDVKCLEGSQVTWTFEFDAPPARLTWSIAGAPAQELQPDKDGKFTASTIIQPGKVTGELVLYKKTKVIADRWLYEIEGLIDKLPVVEIVEPKGNLELISTAQLPVRIRARDDYGIAEFGLVLDAGGERQWLLEKTIDARDSRDVSEVIQLMLDSVPLEITDNVRMYAYALDHKPRGGGRGVSALRAIDIRQFQIRTFFSNNPPKSGGGGEPGANSEDLSNALIKLDQLISQQRSIVSDVFGFKESYRSGIPEKEAYQLPLMSNREGELKTKARELADDWTEKLIAKSEVTLLVSSSNQMEEAERFISTKMLEKGFTSADRALSSLLRLRKELAIMIMKGNGMSDSPSDQQQMPPTLEELAKEARRLAGEEADVSQQLGKKDSENNAEAIRRQQEMVSTDIGELFSKLVDHPEKTDLILQAADKSERAVLHAEKQMRQTPAANALPEVETAKADLLDLATILESADLEKAAETLAKRSQKAEQAAESEKQAADKAQAAAGEGDAKADEKNDTESKPEDQTADQGKNAGKSGQQTEQAARDTQLTDEILKDLAKRAAEKDQENADDTPSAEASALKEARENARAGELAEKLNQLAQSRNPANKPADTKQDSAGEAAADLQRMANALQKSADALNDSKLAELTKLQEQAEKLKNELAQQQGKSPGQGKGQGEKPGEQPAKGQGKGEGEGKGQGESQNQTAQGNGQGKGQGKGEKDGEGGEGTKPGHGSQGGSEGGLGGTMQRGKISQFANQLDRLKDDQLSQIAPPLRNFDFDSRSLPLLDQASKRLEEMIAAMPVKSQNATAGSKMPEEGRREVEDYFRSLSDDFGDEATDSKQ
jgi:hypothetical protein